MLIRTPTLLGSLLTCLQQGRRVLALAGILGGLSVVDLAVGEEQALRLDECVQLVLSHNEGLQVRLLETEIKRRLVRAEQGVFEPQFVGNLDHLDSTRPNTSEQQANLFFRRVFDQDNELYSGALEFLAPSGARLRAGYTLQDLANNLNAFESEYATFVGVNLTQPLLRGGGTAATMAGIRAAAVQSELAFQEYRKQLMVLVSRAEAAYWDLHLTQEQVKLAAESVRVARSVLGDVRQRLTVGKGSELEVLESESGLEERLAVEREAAQRLLEARNNLAGLLSRSVAEGKPAYLAIESPSLKPAPASYYEGWLNARALNPDYLSRRRQAVLEQVRVGYARNQRRPQLDLKASYGLNGLGDSPGEAWDEVQTTDFPAWSVGVELRVPLAGNLRGREEYAAAQLREQQALVQIREMEVQIDNALDASLRRVQRTVDNAASYKNIAEFNQELLEAQIARLEVGKTDSRTVLETEERLFRARIALLDSMVQHEKAFLEWQLVQGNLLQARRIDLSQADLQWQTRGLVRSGRLEPEAYRRFMERMAQEYERLRRGDTPEVHARALRALREIPAEPATTRPQLPPEAKP